MPLTILNVAYPLAPVTPDAVGGVEQIVYALDRGIVAAGHRSIVLACAGSQTAGELVATPLPSLTFDTHVHAKAARQHRRAIDRILATRSVDLVHLHGHDFDMYLPAEGVPTLATLHLPQELLIAHLTMLRRANTWVHGVSRAQHARLPRVPFLLPPIENGVDVDRLPRATRRRGFALVLSRVCPEKGIHLALEAARRARMPLLVAGTTFPYDEHQRYWNEEVRPRLDRDRRFVGPVSRAAKRLLLSAARCLLVPSLVEETSSLVAMEALACGTPVVAFANGALKDIVQHGVTGMLVKGVDEMADAIRRAGDIDGHVCQEQARAEFSAERMVARYLERYQTLRTWSRTAWLSHAMSASSV